MVGGDAFGFGFEVGDEAVAQRGQRGGLEVLEADVEAALCQRADFAGEDERLRAARAAAEAQILVRDRRGGVGLGMRGEHEAHGVILHVRGDRDFAHELHEFAEVLAGQNFVHLGLRAGGGAIDDFGQFIRARVADNDFEEEAVELCFGQRIGAFLVNRVLRGHDEEGFAEFAKFAAGGDLLFLHGFEHGRLGLGRGAIDFVGENQVREDRAALELEGAFARVGVHDEVRAENVGGHEVGRELDAIERHVEYLAERADEERLAEAGHAFEQHMSAAEQSDEGVFDDGGVADDDFADLGLESGVGVAEGLDLGFGAHGFYLSHRLNTDETQMEEFFFRVQSVFHPWLKNYFFKSSK